MPKEKLDIYVMTRLLDWSYDKAVNGVTGFATAKDLGDEYLKREGTLEEKIKSLIRWQNTKCAVSGFLSGLGGILTLPVAVPANVGSVMYVQVRMIAAIAHMCGHDVHDDRVKPLVYACLCGNAAKDILKEIGINIGTKLSKGAIKKLSFEVVKDINKAVGFRLLTKFGPKGAITLGKAVPLVGGGIGATFDAVSTNTIGKVAKKTFLEPSKSNTVVYL